MRLATRLGIVFGVGSLLAVVSVGVSAWLFARAETIDAVDRQLQDLADRLVALSEAASRVEAPPADPNSDAFLGGVEVYDADGMLLLGELGLLSAADVETAMGQSGPATVDLELDGREYRMFVAPVEEVAQNPLGEVEVIVLYEDITERLQALDRLQQRIALLAGLAFVALSAVGWLVGRRLARPLGEVTEAAEELARLDGVPSRIEVDRTDEVGRLAQSFNRVIAALEIAREQQQRLVADASHELRTPLTSLRMRIEFLESNDSIPSDRRQEMFAGAVADLGQLTALVAELIDLAADIQGGDETPVSVELGPILAEGTERAAAATGRRIDLVADRSRAVVRPNMITRAVGNLLDNAAKYSPDGSPIAVRLHDGAIEVSDAGPGIPAGERALVFDRFYRSPQARGRPGNGIGLAIVKQVADIHDGQAWVGTSAAGGAAVGFSVPTESA